MTNLKEIERNIGAADGRDFLSMGIYDDIQIARRVLVAHVAIYDHLISLGYEGSTEKMVDQLVEAAVARKTERDQARTELASAVEMGIKLADYLESATEIIEEDGGDEEDVRDARELITKARALFGVQPSKERESP